MEFTKENVLKASNLVFINKFKEAEHKDRNWGNLKNNNFYLVKHFITRIISYLVLKKQSSRQTLHRDLITKKYLNCTSNVYYGFRTDPEYQEILIRIEKDKIIKQRNLLIDNILYD